MLYFFEVYLLDFAAWNLIFSLNFIFQVADELVTEFTNPQNNPGSQDQVLDNASGYLRFHVLFDKASDFWKCII